MDLRARITTALKAAMKNREAERLGTLRLINAAIKDRDIALRGDGAEQGVGEEAVLVILGRMVKQRKESARAYEEGGRLDLAERERAEIAVIEDFLPRQLSDDEVSQAIDATIDRLHAASIRDMGRVMAALKAEYGGQMDFGQVGPSVRARLTGG